MDPAMEWAVRQLRCHPHVRISAVADRIGRSARWFVDRFTAEVGLTPKVFGRVQRFQSALQRIHHAPNVGLADVAVAAGYYDQSHFIHDFRMIAGMTPTAYMSAVTESHNHVACSDDLRRRTK